MAVDCVVPFGLRAEPKLKVKPSKLEQKCYRSEVKLGDLIAKPYNTFNIYVMLI